MSRALETLGKYKYLLLLLLLGLMLLAWGCYALLTHSFGPERQGSLTAQIGRASCRERV